MLPSESPIQEKSQNQISNASNDSRNTKNKPISKKPKNRSLFQEEVEREICFSIVSLKEEQ